MKRVKVLGIVLLAVAALVAAAALDVAAMAVRCLGNLLLSVLKIMMRLDDGLQAASWNLVDTARGWVRWATR